MNKKEKEKFISELIDTVKEEMINVVGEMPVEWDGIELRQYIADKFADCVIKGIMSRRRKLAYNNTMIVDNL